MEKKNCNGKVKAKGYGCNELNYLNPMHKGLCLTCWKSWLINTENGKEHLNKIKIKAKKEIKNLAKQEKTRKKRELMSSDKYRSLVLQPIINEIARLIDYGQPCIATGNINGKMNGGHYHSTGAYRNCALNLHNIHIQSFQSNHFKSGDQANYRNGIIATYGIDYMNYIEGLKTIQSKFMKHELEEAYPRMIEFRNELRKNKKKLSPKERILIRSKANVYIGLHKTN